MGGVLLKGDAMVVVRGGGLAMGAKELKTRSLSPPRTPDGERTEGASEEIDEKENRLPILARETTSSREEMEEWSLPAAWGRPEGGRLSLPGG